MSVGENNHTSKHVCKNCNSINIDNYCSYCGQKVYNERFNLKSFFDVLFDAFSVEKGFIYALKMLFIAPGKIINGYLNGKTRAYFNPLKYFLIIAGINAVLMIWLNVFDSNIENSSRLMGVDDSTMQLSLKVREIIKQYINIISILIIPFNSLVSKLYFRKFKLNYAEHIIINTFLGAQGLLITLCFYPIYTFFPILYHYTYFVNFFIVPIFYSYGFYKVFKPSVFKATLGAYLTSYLGHFLFIISVLSIFILSVFIMKFFGISLKELLLN